MDRHHHSTSHHPVYSPPQLTTYLTNSPDMFHNSATTPRQQHVIPDDDVITTHNHISSSLHTSPSQSVAGSRRVSFAERLYELSSQHGGGGEKRRLSCIDLKNSDQSSRKDTLAQINEGVSHFKHIHNRFLQHTFR